MAGGAGFVGLARSDRMKSDAGAVVAPEGVAVGDAGNRTGKAAASSFAGDRGGRPKENGQPNRDDQRR